MRGLKITVENGEVAVGVAIRIFCNCHQLVDITVEGILCCRMALVGIGALSFSGFVCYTGTLLCWVLSRSFSHIASRCSLANQGDHGPPGACAPVPVWQPVAESGGIRRRAAALQVVGL